TKQRDELTRARQALPWVKVDKSYVFDGPNGKESLSDLFDGRSQLIVYHFMYHPSWGDEACKSCSFWADNFNGIIVHVNARDVSMVAISKARLEQIDTYKRRMGWSFKWLSSCDNDFNRDYHVSFTDEEVATGKGYYNYGIRPAPREELPGMSVFAKDDDGEVFHTYSAYARGLDMVNGAYHYLDTVPKGRDEDGLPWNQAWICRHDEYGKK
ncbi:MAG: DUF899 domain-containing protein, partial [Gammaproteobacteria bacterium]